MSKKILIVDDSRETIRMVGAELHKRRSFEVINAANGEMGIKVAKEELPDLILMDWDMPVMDGIQATRHLANDDQTAQIPVIVSTGRMTTSEDLELALASGAMDYIRKPIDFVELHARISAALRMKEQQEAIHNLLRNEIELKNRQLSTTSMLIVEKNNLMKEYYDQLAWLQKLCKGDEADFDKQVKNLRKRIINHIEVDDSWQTFKIHFDQVNPVFFDKLAGFDLSQKDLKLCAYIKMGMDNKQISQLLNITHGSMRTAIYRMKKKMGLAEEVNLREYVAEL